MLDFPLRFYRSIVIKLFLQNNGGLKLEVKETFQPARGPMERATLLAGGVLYALKPPVTCSVTRCPTPARHRHRTSRSPTPSPPPWSWWAPGTREASRVAPEPPSPAPCPRWPRNALPLTPDMVRDQGLDPMIGLIHAPVSSPARGVAFAGDIDPAFTVGAVDAQAPGEDLDCDDLRARRPVPCRPRLVGHLSDPVGLRPTRVTASVSRRAGEESEPDSAGPLTKATVTATRATVPTPRR